MFILKNYKMFDIGWTEILILAMLVYFYWPEEIPKFLGYIGKMIAKVEGLVETYKTQLMMLLKIVN